MNFYLFILIFVLANYLNVFSQDNDSSSSKKPKPPPKSLELLKMMEDESDVLYKENQFNNKRIEDYIAGIKNSTNTGKNEVSLLKVSSELVRIYSIINNRVYKNSLNLNQEVKKIEDVIEKSNNHLDRFVAVNNGNHLLVLNSSKSSEKVSVLLDNQPFSLNEISRDENWRFAIYEWEKKPAKNLFVTTFESVSPVGSVLFKVGFNGHISPCIVSLENRFSYKEKAYKYFHVSELESFKDGDYFFNEKGSLVGVAYELKGKKIILDGQFISVIFNEMFESIGGETNLGLIGKLTETGFVVNGVFNQDNKILKNDIVQEIDNIKIAKENLYSIKQSLKKKKLIEVKILRAEKQENLKCSTLKDMSLSNLKLLTGAENKVILWVDPIDSNQLADATEFMKACKQNQFDNYEFKFYRIKEDSLLFWFATVKLVRYLLKHEKSEIFDWFRNNPYQDSDEFIAKFNLKFSLTQNQYAEVLDNKNEEDLIMTDYTNGFLKHKIKSLPALSFFESEGVSKTQEIALWIREFLSANSL